MSNCYILQSFHQLHRQHEVVTHPVNGSLRCYPHNGVLTTLLECDASKLHARFLTTLHAVALHRMHTYINIYIYSHTRLYTMVPARAFFTHLVPRAGVAAESRAGISLPAARLHGTAARRAPPRAHSALWPSARVT